MPSQGPNNPTSAVSTGSATASWNAPDHAEVQDGIVTAAFITGSAGAASQELQVTAFGFSIPVGATINGIQVNVVREATNGGIQDNDVTLLKAGSPVGNNKATAVAWPLTLTTASYGASNDLWGATWTPSDINNSSFGVQLSAQAPGGGLSLDADVDVINVTVTYTPAPAPTVTSCSPNTGSTSGGQSVTITGSNFLATPTSITFGGTAATNIVFNSPTSVSCTTPAHAAGTVNVVVTNPDGQTGTGTNVYTFNAPPTVSSCNPSGGSTSGGQSVTISGSSFQATPTSITFGGTAATNIVFNSATSVSCTTPAHAAGTVNVVVTNPDGQTGTGTNVYTFNAPPTVTSCNPPSGPPAGGNNVTITGTNFLATPTSITFGGAAATNIVFNSATSVSCTAPAHAAGTVNVVVTDPDGQSATGTNVYTYNPPPGFSSCNPGNGPAAGGTSVTISGANFVATPSVTFDGVAASNVTFVSSTTLTCTTPVHSPVTVDIVITNPDGQSTTGSKVFLYLATGSRFLSF